MLIFSYLQEVAVTPPADSLESLSLKVHQIAMQEDE
jgi:hypothetical protein